MNEHENFLNDLQLAARWGYSISTDLSGRERDSAAAAIKKKHQRLRTLPKSSPRHLKSFRPGKSPLYRVTDVLAYEERNTK